MNHALQRVPCHRDALTGALFVYCWASVVHDEPILSQHCLKNSEQLLDKEVIRTSLARSVLTACCIVFNYISVH